MAGRLSRLVLNLRRNIPPGTPLDRHLQRFAKVAGWFGAELDLLAALYGTDKFGEHDYTPVYDELMRASRRKAVRLLEVGVIKLLLELGHRRAHEAGMERAADLQRDHPLRALFTQDR